MPMDTVHSAIFCIIHLACTATIDAESESMDDDTLFINDFYSQVSSAPQQFSCDVSASAILLGVVEYY